MNFPLDPHVPSLPSVLVVDDEARSQDAIRRTLDEDFEVRCASSADEARAFLEQDTFAVILCDQRMPGTNGVMFLREVRSRWPDTVRIIISGYTDSEDLIAGINEAGIYQYILKPWSPDHLLEAVRQAAETQTLQHQTQRLDLELRTTTHVLRQRTTRQLAQARHRFDFERIVREPGSPLDAVCVQAARAAQYDVPMLLLGESGTGKELMARAIHYASPRRTGPFAVENCAALTDTLLESELFGHKRGAFTGAYEDHVGLFQRAHNGTVFLDEIGDTSAAFQVKLLRVLQEGEVRPVGASRAVPVHVRVLAATHRALEQRVREGLFREDLYYRLAGISLTIPPLRERLGDLAALAAYLVQDICEELGCSPMQLHPESLMCLMGYPWPGNIRELRNELRQALVLFDGVELLPEYLSPRVRQGRIATAISTTQDTPFALPQSGTLMQRLDVVEAILVRDALLRHRWNKTRAAQELGLSRVGLRSKMQRLGLNKA
jgi:two-component system response regulator HupR/HoxA